MKKWEVIKKQDGVTFYQPIESIDDTKKSMKRFYDKCNEVFKSKPEFFLKEKNLRKNKENVFI